MNQTFPEQKNVKEQLDLDTKEDYKFIYDYKHDEVIFAVYNPGTKEVRLEFFDGTTLQDLSGDDKSVIHLNGTGDQ